MDTAVRQCDGTGQALTASSNRPTIFARSTGALPSAIAIVRISGPACAETLIKLSRKKLPAPRTAVVRTLLHPVSTIALDTALVLWLPGPDTATGEDIVELHLHGGRAVVAAVEAALADFPGLQPAEPGAFTRRAFENGRLDLTQVEGLADLLAAETERQRTAALILAEGGLRRRVEGWQVSLLQLAARAEALIDFADESDVGGTDLELQRNALTLAVELEATLANPPAERLRDGVRVGIAGPPNSGKSTLLNALSGREAAIASPIAGTTRDVIETPVNLNGIPIVFVDMAGLRAQTDDPVEAIGIARAEAAIRQSDVLLWLGNPSDAPAGDHVLRIGAKSDLGEPQGPIDLCVSAQTGEGMGALTARVIREAIRVLPVVGGLTLTVAQQGHIRDTATSLARASDQHDDVLRAEDLRAALRALDRITGSADTEAMLDTLFGRFCIGK